MWNYKESILKSLFFLNHKWITLQIQNTYLFIINEVITHF